MACYFNRYGGNASELAREYCRRGSYFFEMCVDAGMDDLYVYSRELLDSYGEGPLFKDFADRLERDSHSARTVAELRRMVPNRCPVDGDLGLCVG